MELLMTWLLFFLGLFLIIRGGDWFLDGAVWMAERSGLPRFLIGATVVSLATTLPELMVSLMGAWAGETDLAAGNAVGSVTANLGLILGLTLLCAPIAISREQFGLRALLMTSAAAILLLLCRGGTLHLRDSLLLGAVFLCFLINSAADARGMRDRQRSPAQAGSGPGKLLAFAAGIGAIAGGSRLLITRGSALALLLGLPAGVVGATVVAVGTSLPELVTTVTAIRKRETAISVGNIVGANVIDLTLILPACAAVAGGRLPVSARTAELDLPVCLGLCLLAVLPAVLRGRFCRWQGAALLGCYGLYTALLLWV